MVKVLDEIFKTIPETSLSLLIAMFGDKDKVSKVKQAVNGSSR